MMELLRQLIGFAVQFDFTFESHWIPSEANSLADAASRFQFARLFELAPHLEHKPCFKCVDFAPSPRLSQRPPLGLT
ncbi:hypothetical protein F5050DRAFT_390220 [Lentinula boryana]|uniref:RNase H type-1 domain-containing protein n=1 Tax=Lentinula boryana TaxID=40481 RepID=A0ABQ8Q8Y2_9AGAR|nr:hypothetical protein F5050DRAFT_390220 [Lentinula boryana]